MMMTVTVQLQSGGTRQAVSLVGSGGMSRAVVVVVGVDAISRQADSRV